MSRVLIAVGSMSSGLLLLATGAASAQSYGYPYPGPPGYYQPRPPSYGYGYGVDRYERDDRPIWREPRPRYSFAPQQRNDGRYRDRDDDNDRPRGQKLMDGGGRPDIRPIQPQIVPFNGSYKPGTIVIDTGGRQLLLITSERAALRYPISVGRQGFTWTGSETISRIAEWPDWHPPSEMRQRDPSLPEKMTGGVKNPLGAKALYLGNTLYRIHGTNDARTVGQASSSGCFRMLNGHVVDLADRVRVGTGVVVVDHLPRGAVPSRNETDRDRQEQRRRY